MNTVREQSKAEREAFEMGSEDKLKGYAVDACPFKGRKKIEWERGYKLTTKIDIS
jgi:hypothetical protein